MKAAVALLILAITATVYCDYDDDLGQFFEGIDVRCLFDEMLCKDLRSVCLDKPNLTLAEKIQCDKDEKVCIDGLPHDCRNLFADLKATTAKPIS